jgi:hypothetical protein
MKQNFITSTFFILLFAGVGSFSLAAIGSAEAKAPASLSSKIIAIDSQKLSSGATQHCSDDKQTMSACLSFIKGFLQGALLTDAAIIKSIESTEPTFAERAIRTRLGRRASPPTELAGFCLPADRPILSLAQETLDHVKYSKRNSVELANNVYKSLQVDYPCK